MLRRRGAALLRRACNAATDGTADGALRGFSRQIGEQSIPVGVTSTGWMAAARQAVAPLHSLQRGAKAAPAGQQLRRFSGFTDSRGYQHFGKGPGAAGLLAENQNQIIAVVVAGSVVVWWASRQEVPYTHRMHAILIPARIEIAAGIRAFQEILQEAKEQRALLPRGSPAQARVERIGRRIAAIASDGTTGGGFQGHMQGLQWEFVVINSEETNAFVVPGGKVVVYTSMLKLLRSDDELAAVLAHEVGHVLARHAGERMTEYSWIGVFQLAFYYFMGFTLPHELFALGLFLPNSRKQESEADMIGMDLAAQACFEPAAAALVHKKLGELDKRMGADEMPAILRTHPVSDTRVSDIQAHLPKARVWAERSDCHSKQQGLYDFFR
mmetsp:Transcript_20714/g.62420  ORF Transcript_20714/g.62420 Transcript_20714/m.62420 type:complete len:383 (-) Transcript_20714:334-1482(-)